MSILRLLVIALILTAWPASPSAAAADVAGEDTLAAAAGAPSPREPATETFDRGQRLVAGTVEASVPASLHGSEIELVLTLGAARSASATRGTSPAAPRPY
ncbi:MAG TPA: hypothetical protein VGP02_16385 [Mycobacteriales bacterium]|jgi:hypothetical protein|nr:hypothetical protein [Mycobacteriales bacterium]